MDFPANYQHNFPLQVIGRVAYSISNAISIRPKSSPNPAQLKLRCVLKDHHVRDNKIVEQTYQP